MDGSKGAITRCGRSSGAGPRPRVHSGQGVHDVQRPLDKQRAGDGYKLYTELSQDQVKEFASAVDALGEPLSKVAESWPVTSAPLVTEPTGPSLGYRRRAVRPGRRGGRRGRRGAGVTRRPARQLDGEVPGGRADGVDAPSFHGAHQAGIVTPAQDRLHFVALDVTTKDRAKLGSC